MDAITKQKNFWSDDDDLVLKAIREGFLSTQQAMWTDLPNWKKTASGLASTAGTTASVCFIKRGKLFIGHVGDSGIILGERDPHHPTKWVTFRERHIKMNVWGMSTDHCSSLSVINLLNTFSSALHSKGESKLSPTPPSSSISVYI